MELFDPQPLLHWLSAHPGQAGGAVFLIALLESLLLVGLLMPGTLLMFGIGALIALGALPFWPTLAWAFLGAAAGDGISFLLGRRYGGRLRGWWPFRRHPALLEHGERFFARHGGKGVVLGRFVGPVRPVIPAVAGMLGMPPGRFLAFNLLSALAWAPAYLLPGIALGASLQLAAEVAGRLALLLGLLLGLLLLAGWLARHTFLLLQPRAERAVRALLAWGARHPRLGRLSGALVDPRHPEPLGLLGLTGLLVAAVAAFVAVARGVIGSALPGFDDAALFQAVQGLRGPWADQWLAAVSLLADGPLVAVLVGSLCLWLAWRRDWRALAHWLAALAFAALVPRLLKYGFAIPRPLPEIESGYAFPSGHATRAALIYGLLAAFLARTLPLAWRWLPYAAAAVIACAVAFARVYLGAHWPSDVLGGLTLGAAFAALVAVAWSRHALSVPPLAPQLAVAAAALLLFGLPYAALQLEQPPPLARRPMQVMEAAHWRAGGWRELPAYRIDLAGRPRQPLNLQWAGEPAAIATSLEPAGWAEVAPFRFAHTLRWLSPDLPIDRLPLPPRLHDGRHEALRLRWAAADGEWLLRLWQSGVRLADGRPLWLGNLRPLRVVERGGWLRFPSTGGGFRPPPPEFRRLAEAAGWRIEGGRRPAEGEWNGEVWRLERFETSE